MSCLEAAIVTAVSIFTVAGFLHARGEEITPVEQAHRDYDADLIDEQELEHRLGFHLDDRNDQIREVVEQVNNVGEEKSEEIARRFESLDELRRADREDLTAIHGVAESTADAVLARVRE